jgi:VIT1/CCC1 family predicted Fe2+/Mn2+ transporter
MQTQDASDGALGSRLNWLRASVLGANDGVISLAALLTGVAAASVPPHTLLITGVAGLLAGASSMAAGEYVSVASQRDTERTFGVPEDKQTSPAEASIASALSYSVGGIIPLVAILLAPYNVRIAVTYAAMVVALALIGVLSARVSGCSKRRTVLRVMAGGLVAMSITFLVGHFLGNATAGL